MKRLVKSAPLPVLLSMTMLFSAAGAAQEPDRSPLPLPGTMEIPAPNPAGEGPMADQTKPEKIFDFDANPFFYDPDELRKLMQPLGSNSSLSGKKK